MHSVASYSRSGALHWLIVRGLVDADDRQQTEIDSLRDRGVHVLPVAEIENVFLLPSVFVALADALQCSNPSERLARLTDQVVDAASTNIDEVCARHATRQLDRYLKKLTVDARDLRTLENGYRSQLAGFDAARTFGDFKSRLQKSLREKKLEDLLRLYDNKGLLAIATTQLGVKGWKELVEKIGRLLGNDSGAGLREELSKVLPPIPTV